MGRAIRTGLLVLLTVGMTAVSLSAAVTVSVDQSVAIKFSSRHTVTGINTPLPQPPDVTGFLGAAFLSVGDINNDSIKEIVCTSGIGLDGNALTPNDGAVAIFTWDGSDLDSWTQSIINSTFAFPNETLLRDMDGDTDLDIMVMDNFIIAWISCGHGGIYWLENQGGDITSPSNWVKQTIYQETDDGGPYGYTRGAVCNGCSGTGTYYQLGAQCQVGDPGCYRKGAETTCTQGTCYKLTTLIDCTCPPVCEGCGPEECNSAYTNYHRARFVDLDGDGDEDFITTKNHFFYWSWTNTQYTWVEWFRKESDLITYPSGFSGPYEIGEGGGFLFQLADLDGDGDKDVVAGQFFIYDAGFVRKAPGDPNGDSLAWFENPGQVALAADPNLAWTRRTIENEHTSPNPIGKVMDLVLSDIDDDSVDELVVTNHNHQEYSSYSGVPLRYWPSGVYYFEIPPDPKATIQWTPVTIETGRPNLEPGDPDVATDVYAVNRPGGPTGQGSPGLPKAEDINGDGFPELLIPGDGKGAVYYYQNSGTVESYKRATIYKDPACMPSESVFEDIDNDGLQDLIVVIYDTSATKVANQTLSSSIFIYRQDRDVDDDGICNPGDTDLSCSGSDNCPFEGNPGQEDTGDGDGVGDACDNCSSIANPLQEDSYPPGGNNCGNACECEGNFNVDVDVDGGDAATFKASFGRGGLNRPCNNGDPCNGDFTCDGNVSGSDAALFKLDFGRSGLDRPCPSCTTTPWCSY